MTASLRSAVPGQLCLLELFEQLTDPDVLNVPNIPNVSDAPNDSDGVAVRPADEVELGEWERAVLGCSAARYLQALSAMLDRPEVLAAEPELVGRLQALRDRRQQLRTLARRGLQSGVASQSAPLQRDESSDGATRTPT